MEIDLRNIFKTHETLNQTQLQCACSYKSKELNKYIKPDWLPEHNDGKGYTPSYNIAPTDVTPVLISATRHSNSANSSRVLKPMMWGIIPQWHKDDYKNHNISTNNCRIENIMKSKLYSPILKSGGRCVIVFEGFYEWQTTKISKIKQPYYIYSQQENGIKVDDHRTWNNTFDEETGWKGINLIFIAGLYDVWQNNDKIIYSYTIITMESNGTFNWLHHRMPAILDTDELIEGWLDVDNIPAVKAISLLKPVSVLSWHQVSTVVNNSRNKSNDCNKEKDTKNKNVQKTLNSWFITPHKRKCDDDNHSMTKKSKVGKI